MTRTNPRTTLSLCALTLLATAALLSAGPLDPPAGPVTSTHKTLTEVEPRIAINATNTPGDNDASPSLFKITQPGSYYLTGNITGASGRHGIEITASDVVLNLNGFEVLGVPGSLDGVSVTAGANGITIRDGSVRNWGDEGLDLGFAGGVTVRRLDVLGCAGFGISVSTSSTVDSCTARSNTAGGIATGTNCVVVNCAADGNTGGGILAFLGCTISHCTAFTNGGNGISTGNNSTIADCTSTNNSLAGFSVPTGCTISNCTSASNTTSGFSLGNASSIANSVATSNFGAGIVVAAGCSVTSCSARSNGGGGISATNFATISGCTVVANTGAGIAVGNRCHVLSNQCGGTTAAPAAGSKGIFVAGADNRIESNTLTGLERGLDVDFSGNLIIRNVASGNTINWDISATNFGQFVIATNSGAAFAGNTGGAPIGTTDPWVNLSY